MEGNLNVKQPANRPLLIREHQVEQLRFTHKLENRGVHECKRVLFNDVRMLS